VRPECNRPRRTDSSQCCKITHQSVTKNSGNRAGRPIFLASTLSRVLNIPAAFGQTRPCAGADNTSAAGRQNKQHAYLSASVSRCRHRTQILRPYLHASRKKGTAYIPASCLPTLCDACDGSLGQ
jgi:hypothetical protein